LIAKPAFKGLLDIFSDVCLEGINLGFVIFFLVDSLSQTNLVNQFDIFLTLGIIGLVTMKYLLDLAGLYSYIILSIRSTRIVEAISTKEDRDRKSLCITQQDVVLQMSSGSSDEFGEENRVFGNLGSLKNSDTRTNTRKLDIRASAVDLSSSHVMPELCRSVLMGRIETDRPQSSDGGAKEVQASIFLPIKPSKFTGGSGSIASTPRKPTAKLPMAKIDASPQGSIRNSSSQASSQKNSPKGTRNLANTVIQKNGLVVKLTTNNNLNSSGVKIPRTPTQSLHSSLPSSAFKRSNLTDSQPVSRAPSRPGSTAISEKRRLKPQLNPL
jgi:hypothetical protein